MWLRGVCVLAMGLWLTAVAAAQENAARVTYSIASVKPSDPKLEEGSVTPLPNGVGYSVVRVTLRDMLAVMYRVPSRQVVGGPEWVRSEHFDVEAKSNQSYSTDELHEMFERLLEDRFNLKVRVVDEAGPAYVLTVAPSGLKMRLVDVGTDRHSPIHETTANHYKGDRVPLNYLSFWLGQNLQEDQRSVVDRTGLTGTYSFDLAFRPQEAPAALDNGDPSQEELPTIFQALKQQLGLVLTPQKAPVPKVVIEHVEKPSEN